ncbi:annexin D4 [Silene latifolia]|uniref:annexin D4 n=1 Tax=Silene latifolia TaxID=37657 RepID=UPI003D77987D
MAHHDEHQALSKAFSGLGVDESAFISILGKWQHEHKHTFRKSSPHLFQPDERQFERWDQDEIARLRHEVLRFKSAIVMWTMHPWERDARLFKEALAKGPEGNSLIIELACTRSSEELLGARRAYHSLFDHSVEEDVASLVVGQDRKLLVALVSSYRYEGPRLNDEIAKSEAKVIHDAIKVADKKAIVQDEEVVRILSTRSKVHLNAVFRHYKELFGKHLDEDLHEHLSLKVAVQCFVRSEIYFSEALNAALNKGADEFTQEALTRVVITQAHINMAEIKAEYHNKFGIHLSQEIEHSVLGNFKDFLLALVDRQN